MSEQTEPTEETADGPGRGAGDQAAAEPVPIGNEKVVAVLEALNELDDAPLEEHVAAYEEAHESLRGALDA